MSSFDNLPGSFFLLKSIDWLKQLIEISIITRFNQKVRLLNESNEALLLFEASNSLQNDNLVFPEVCRRCLSTTTTDSPNHYLVQSVDTGRRVAVLKIPLGGPVFSGLQGLPGRQTAKTLTSDRARRSCTRFDLTITSSSTSFPSSSSSSIFSSPSSCVFFWYMTKVCHRPFFCCYIFSSMVTVCYPQNLVGQMKEGRWRKFMTSIKIEVYK